MGTKVTKCFPGTSSQEGWGSPTWVAGTRTHTCSCSTVPVPCEERQRECSPAVWGTEGTLDGRTQKGGGGGGAPRRHRRTAAGACHPRPWERQMWLRYGPEGGGHGGTALDRPVAGRGHHSAGRGDGRMEAGSRCGGRDPDRGRGPSRSWERLGSARGLQRNPTARRVCVCVCVHTLLKATRWCCPGTCRGPLSRTSQAPRAP